MSSASSTSAQVKEMSDFSSVAGSQIKNLVQTLNKKNYRAHVSDVEKILQEHGYEAYRFLFRLLVSEINFHNTTQADQFKIQLLTQELAQLTSKPNFASLVAEMMEVVKEHKGDFLLQITKMLSLPLAQQVMMGISLSQATDSQTQQEGITFLKTKLAEIQQSGPTALPENLVIYFLNFILTNDNFASERTSILASFEQYMKSHPSVAPLYSKKDDLINSKRNLLQEVNGSPSGNSDRNLSQLLEENVSISGFMKDMGYSCLSNVETFTSILSKFPRLTEADVAQIVGMMAQTHTGLEEYQPLQYAFSSAVSGTWSPLTPQSAETKAPTSWNTDVFVNVMKKMLPHLDWKSVIRHLDYPGFRLVDQKGLALIISIYKKVTEEDFQVDFLLGDWENKTGQLSFLALALAAPPDVINFGLSQRKVSVGALPRNLQNVTWSSLDLIETLLNLAEGENYDIVRSLFEYPMKNCPEQLLIGLAQTQPKRNALRMELIKIILPTYVRPHKNSFIVLSQLFKDNQALFINCLVEMYLSDPSILARILDISLELKSLNQFLEARPFSFLIDFAMLASRREYLNLEKWLEKAVHEYKDPFVQSILNYIDEKFLKATADMPKEERAAALPISLISTLMKSIEANRSTISPELYEQVHQFFQVIAELNPKVMNFADSTSQDFDKGVEEEANAYFKKIFNLELSIDETIALLKRFKDSDIQREKELFVCMIHNLFDEYRFFHKYPEKFLRTTGILFGSIIKENLIFSTSLGIALRYVAASLKKPQNQKMFQFGVVALDQFKSRLPEWPQYCAVLKEVPQLAQACPEAARLIDQTLAAAASGAPPAVHVPAPEIEQTRGASDAAAPKKPEVPTVVVPTTTTPSTPAPAASSAPPPAPASPQREATPKPVISSPARNTKSFGTSLNIDVLTAGIENPPSVDEATADKIHFILNNLSQANMEQKAQEIKDFLNPNHYNYLAFYLVVRRASLEPNFHQIYIKFLDTLKMKELNNAVLEYTYSCVNVLLKSETIASSTSTSERTLLKNLGSWLGSLTLAKNTPILQKKLALKELILDAYERGRLIAVVPFVAKVLDKCSNSKVFKPPNPWLMGLVSLLAELHHINDLKLNLKFEVEVLCKSLNLKVADIETKGLLKDRQMAKPPNPDLTQQAAAAQSVSPAPLPVSASPVPAQPSPVLPAQPMENIAFPPPEKDLQQAPTTDSITAIPGLEPHVIINPNITLFTQFPPLKKCVHIAVDRAICEIIAPVVERSVAIACITTRELILKDFAMEGDEQKMLQAAHLMVKNLAGNLAMVTCKDPLRVSMGNQLRTLLQASGADPSQIEQAVNFVTSENLDLGCAFVQKAARDKAVNDIDEALAGAYQLRKTHRESNPGQPFAQMFGSRFAQSLPETIRPKLGGITPQQQRVYDDFGINVFPGRPFGPSETETHKPPETIMQHIQQAKETQMTEEAQAVLASLRSLNMYLDELEKQALLVTQKGGVETLSALPPTHDLYNLLRTILTFIKQFATSREITLRIGQRVFSKIYEVDGQFLGEIYLAILESLIQNYDIVKDITTWITYLDDERKFHKPMITISLIKYGMVKVEELDSHVAKLIVGGNRSALSFGALVLKKCVIEQAQLYSNSANATPPLVFAHVLETLYRLSRSPETPEGLVQLVDEARRAYQECGIILDEKMEIKVDDKELNEDLSELKERVSTLFQEWLILVNQPTPDEVKVRATFIAKVQKAGLLKGDEITDKFFRVLMELSVEAFNFALAQQQQQQPPADGSQINVFQAVDAYNELILTILKMLPEPNLRANRTNLVNKLLSVISKTLVKDYKLKRSKFNQRPYLRFFSNMLIDLNALDSSDNNFATLAIFSNTLHLLQPAFLPGFAFAWLELISHRMFMPKLLFSKFQKGWHCFQRLLVDLFKFLEPYLRNAELNGPVRLLYRGTLKILLVLLHDFPEFLCDYHFSFCDVIPPSCIQMRNLILSAFPRHMRLPDPFTPNLKVDLLPEINQSPRILSKYTASLEASNLKEDLDTYLKTRAPATFLNDLKVKLLLSTQQDAIASGTSYNVPLINSLVLYCGIFAINQFQTKLAQATSPIVNSPAMDIFRKLVIDLDSEGRYLFLNALASQLRYPNNHTHYFSCVLLYLFAETRLETEIIQEQITRVLLERLIVNRPHPWGLLITFIELVKNPRYHFWKHSFIRCAPEIEKLFENVCRSCVGGTPKPEDQDLIA